MRKNVMLGIMLTLLLIGMLTLAFNIQPAKSEWTGTVYIRADGSIDPPGAPIQRNGSIYTLTGNITSSVNGIVVERDNIVIDGDGYMLRRTGAYQYKGIVLSGRTNVTVQNIQIQNFRHGIWLNSCSNNTISGNNIANNGYGVWLRDSSNNSISGNNVTANNYAGIQLEYSSNNTFSRNNITANDGLGIVLQSSSNYNSIVGNNITNNYGGILLLDYSSKNIFSGNSITANSRYGIWLDDECFYNSISGNSIKNNYDGIWLYYSSYNSISGNGIANNRLGIVLQSSSNNTIVGNNITANSGDGIVLQISSNYNSIVGNSITANNYGGISLSHSSNYNSISRNSITANNGHAIRLYSSSNNTFSRNNITANKGLGIWLEFSSNNNIYHNNFINNTNQVYSKVSISFWDDGYHSGGNYWSDYTGVDLFSGPYQNETGSDGIGDIPFVIDENNVDRYPLMGPFNSFNASVGYSVDVVSNSTIGDFRYFESNSTIIMHVSNMTANQTVGFCRLTIPHDVMYPSYTVKVNDTITNFQTIYENYTEGISIIYFTYEHSKLEITIIPEYPSMTIMLLLSATLVTTTLTKRKLQRRKRIKEPQT